MTPLLYVALLHYPMRDRNNKVVCTAITNLDIHDIARSCRTYGVQRYFVVTPVAAQQWLARRILHHWEEGWGSTYNPNRKDALAAVEIASDLGEVSTLITKECGQEPVWVATSAKRYPHTISFADLRQTLLTENTVPHCLLFGTGWGIHPDLIQETDLILEPIVGQTDYNHLSVRAAVAITLDRLITSPITGPSRQSSASPKISE